MISNNKGHSNLTPNVQRNTPGIRYSKDTISLYKEYRNQGIGTALLQQMLILLKADGYKSVSLSVQKANYAMQMYQKAGFQIISDDADEAIMKCTL